MSTAYQDAEKDAAAFLFHALGLAPGRDAFIGHPPSYANGVTFQFDEAPREYGAQFQTARALRRVALYASLRIVSPVRAEVARLLSTALTAFPYARQEGSPLEQLRVRDDGLAAIAPVTVYRPTADGEPEATQAYAADLGMDAVFALPQEA